MSILRADQLYAFATAAGFTGSARDNIVAISMAESGGNTQAQNCSNPGGSCDRGLLQINNYWHKEISDQCAYDPLCSFQAAYQISSGGTDFSPWTTFKSGAYTKYLNPATPSYTSPNTAGTQPSANFLNSTGGNIMTALTQHTLLFTIAIVAVIMGFVIMSRSE